MSLAIAKVTNDSEDGGLSIEFTTKQVRTNKIQFRIQGGTKITFPGSVNMR